LQLMASLIYFYYTKFLQFCKFFIVRNLLSRDGVATVKAHQLNLDNNQSNH